MSALDRFTVLALNCGSSSLKFGLYQVSARKPALLYEGEAEEVGNRAHSTFWMTGGASQNRERIEFPDHGSALAHALRALKDCGAPDPGAVGHRFVHGGPRLREHRRLTPLVREQLEEAVAFAPLHVPPALAVLDAMQDRLPGATQVICVDTAFHRLIPDVARTFALPGGIRRRGIERYGFHGLSLESILAQLDPVPERMLVAHLGNGSSITAIRHGKSVDTSMGLTPTGGVMMGTRCGDLDPGVILYLVRNGYGDASRLEAMLDHQSGLLGVSEKTSDVRELLAMRKQNASADLALRMFCYQVRKTIAGMTAALGGLDELIFTGGIGEHATELREEICAGLTFLYDCQPKILPAQEDLQIARITANLRNHDGEEADENGL